MENKVLQTADISIEEMIEKLQKVSNSTQVNAVTAATGFSALLTAKLKMVCYRYVSNNILELWRDFLTLLLLTGKWGFQRGGKYGALQGGHSAVYWVELLSLRKSVQRRGPHLLKHLFAPQVSYGFSSSGYDRAPLAKGEGPAVMGLIILKWSLIRTEKKLERFLATQEKAYWC